MVPAGTAPYADRVARLEACLVDAYDTIVTCDFSALRREVPVLAGISADAWDEEYGRIGAWLTDGRISKTQAFGQILRACGADADPGLVREMVRRDHEVLLANARLYDDAIPFLEKLRARGIKIAVVSNCTENTRPMLVSLGVDALADALVLSCEVGAAKPAAEIFRCALDQLGVTADAAVFVDDQPGYCAGGAAVGIAAVQIVRGELDGQVPAAGTSGGSVAAGSRGHVPGVTLGVARRWPRPRLGGMDTGVAIFPTHDAIAPAEMARLAEERGHESLFFPEHTHIPADRQSPWPGGRELPRKYAHTFDLFVAVTAALTVTSRLRVGSGICLVVERDPITTAKEVASVDYLSGGRFEFGVGAGWNREEMANHGTDPRRRMALLRERVEAMKAIWTSDEASYAGEYVSFERIWSWPKPAQRPYPPVLVGGNGPGVLDRVLAFGDAWFPNHAPSGILDRAAELRSRADRPVGLMVMGVPADAKVLEAYAEAGFQRAVHWLPSAPRGPVERALDRYEAAIAELNGE